MPAYADLESRLKRSIRRHKVPGASLAVLKGDRIVATAAAGVTNLDTQVPVTPDAVFQIGSITKVFTATLIMQLVDDGLLSLDTPIVDYLPEFQIADPVTRRGVTARHLLTHTSGIDGDFFVDSGRGDDAIERLMPMMTLLPSLFPLGTKMSYCNVGFALLGRIVEVLRRETYDHAMRHRIFKPLGMKQAMTLAEDALRHRCAVGHIADPKDPKRLRVAFLTHLSHGMKSAGSTPAMSAPDLMKFVAMHLAHGRVGHNARVVSAASAIAMQRRHIRLQKQAPSTTTGWGLGWALMNFGGHKVIGHDGGTIGQYSFLRVSPEKRFAIALLTNGGDALSVYEEMVSEPFGAAIRHREPELPPPDDDLRIEQERYIGRYENIQSAYVIDSHRGTLRFSTIPKGEMGLRLTELPLAFIDRETAVLRSGNPQLDRTSALFSDLHDGRYRYIQVGLRQFRRVD
jgi:CubicO group peptidase (beta-lactamase class C family)